MTSRVILAPPIYLLYTEGQLGLHKGKPIFMAAYHSKAQAEGEMIKILKTGQCAFIVQKDVEMENI